MDQQPAPRTGHAVEDLVERLLTTAGRDKLTLQDLIEAGGASSFLPALMVPALLVVSPLSGIPVFSSICGLTIALVAAQLLLGRDHLWLPRFLSGRPLVGARVRPAIERTAVLARWFDRHSRDRLSLLTTLPLVKLPQSLAIFCGLSMPFLELLPFSSSILGLAVISFSVAFLARDGFYVVAGILLMGVAAMIPITVWMQIAG